MKIIRSSSQFPLQRRIRKKTGFALIATLSLLMLLAMLAVALLSLSSTQQRIALQTVLLAEARQQALVGLDVAIGELQVEMGPDRRVSANSGILGDGKSVFPSYVLGVWDSWDGTLYGASPINGMKSIQMTYSKGRDKLFRRWMISSRDNDTIRRMSTVKEVSSRKPGQRICMVGEGTLGNKIAPQYHVYADLLEMPSRGKNKACFAWWVGGENQKAKISIQNPAPPEDAYEALSRTWDTPAPRFVDNDELAFLPEKTSRNDSLLSLATLPLLGSEQQDAGMPYFFDVTTSSYSLITNVRTGGFKQDLNLLLNKKTLKGTEFEARTDQDCPLVENDDVPKGTEPDMPIGSWQNLHAFYHCWPDGSADDSKNFTARLLGDLSAPYTRMSGCAYSDEIDFKYNDNPDDMACEGYGSAYDTRSMLEEGSESAGYARTPVMLAFMMNFGLTIRNQGTLPALSGSGKETAYSLRMCFAPLVLWWNPYNVPMRVRGQQLWSQSAPYKVLCMETYAKSGWTKNKYGWSDYGLNQGGGENSPGFGQDYGDYFQNSTDDAKEDIVFQPGEIIFFSPATGRSNYNEGFTNPWIPGYHPASVAGYESCIYPGKRESEVINDSYHIAMRMAQIAGWQYRRKPDGYWFGPNQPECLTVYSGFNGINARSNKRAYSPQRFLLSWYKPEEHMGTADDGANDGMVFLNTGDGTWRLDGSQQDNQMPYFVASVGVVTKSANTAVDAFVKPGDWRCKIWQHSSPAFWGSSLSCPDDQMRQYHPYQLAALPVASGLNTSPMDNIGRNGFLGICGDGEQVSFASVMELPVHPPFSLAGFAGMRLQPGWYKANPNSNHHGWSVCGAMRRAQYQAGVPGVGIGNAFADPCIPADDVYTYFSSGLENELLTANSRVFGDFYDHGLLINDAMWDRWFCSSVSDMPTKKHLEKAEDVLIRFLKKGEPLPVSRYKKVNKPYDDSELVERIMKSDGWKHIAQYLMIDGGFNVNSTSVEAWTATLQGLADRKLVTGKNDKLSYVEKDKSSRQVLFSRFMLSTTDTSVDKLGGYSMLQGSSNFRDSGMASAWGEVRMLESEEIRQLAEKIVEQVRERGPFLNMSDFVNRRLEAGKHGLKGALQAAIDATDINRDFEEVQVRKVGSGELYKNAEAAMGSIHTAAPGYLIQSDILTSLGNILTVRDDTFTVRAYGCVRSPRNAILAQAWCEAIVQRSTDYVDPSNNPIDSEYKPDGTKADGLTDVNKVLGRQFRVVSFKWLDLWDI